MNEFKELQRQYRVMALLSVWQWLGVILIALIWIFAEIFSPRVDPIDDQATRSHEFVARIFVVDDSRNGFRVDYITKEPVTKDRLDEIQRRSSVRDSLERLKRMAPQVLGDMLRTDIYEFADFAMQFDPADVQIHDIFVTGPDKEKLYIGANPRIKNWAKWIDPGTLQGLLYINSDDIYCNTARVYRYYKCYGIHQISLTDEHFSHFSEDERIY